MVKHGAFAKIAKKLPFASACLPVRQSIHPRASIRLLQMDFRGISILRTFVKIILKYPNLFTNG